MRHEWENLYKIAVLETDWSIIEDRLQAADSAISVRLQEFSLNHGGTPEENKAIRDALSALAVLRREVAEWHGSKQVGLAQRALHDALHMLSTLRTIAGREIGEQKRPSKYS